jgi:anaerobic selenocysteine-containing dehydrogenase
MRASPQTADRAAVVRTMCPMNCHPTLCGMLAEVRDGQLVAVRGDPDNPDSRGFLCVRGQASREVIGNPGRLLRPLLRERRGADGWREASWEEALDRIVAAMEAAGREAVGLWGGHGIFANNYGTRIGGQLIARFAHLYGCQWWHPSMICWGLGGFGVGLTGVLETHTKEDLGAHAELVVLWGANLASQPNTAPHLLAAKRRGAHVVAIDVRRTEATAQADEVLLIRPGTDAALALALMHVIVGEGLHDRAFVAGHTVGFDALAAHVRAFTPAWAAGETGLAPDRIAALARRYAATRPAMIVLGGSSMHKGPNGWQAARAIACLPALAGHLGVPGGGLGPRHGGASHGQGVASVAAPERRPPGAYIPNQMPLITQALLERRVKVLLLPGTNLLSSFADTGQVAAGLERTELVVGFDLFMNETTRRYADVVLPATAWLEELGCKMTNTHVYLMERALDPPGETRSLFRLLNDLAGRLGVAGFDPWGSEERLVDAILDHPATGRATVASLRAQGGFAALHVSPVAHPALEFPTPSGKVEFHSARAEAMGLPPLPQPAAAPPADPPLVLCSGRTLDAFHSFYDEGRALPTLARREPEPRLWMAPADAAARGLQDGAPIRIHNARGAFQARARVTEQVPPGVVWMRDGWSGLNALTDGRAALPEAALDLFEFSVGQARFDARVEVSPA